MNNISLQQQALLELIKIGIGTSEGSFDFSCLSDTDWVAVMKESMAQSVGVLCFDAAEKVSTFLPKKVYQEWLTYSAKILYNNLNVTNAQDWLVNLFESSNIPYVILKGTSSASFYPSPDKRTLGDVDFITKPELFEQAESLLLKAGCSFVDKYMDLHDVFKKFGVSLENHFDIAGTPEGKAGEIIKSYLMSITDDYVVERACVPFRRPSNKLHGAVILLHTLHHILSAGVGLRHICDWACFVNKTHTEKFWSESLIPLFKSAGLFKFCCILTNITVKFLNVAKPDWLENVDEDATQILVLDVFLSGNFGKKEKKAPGTTMMFTKNSEKQTAISKVRAMFKVLNKTNHIMYPILNSYPWLYPFIVFWRIIRYIFLRIIGKRQSFTKASRYADKMYNLVSKFDLYKTDKE